MVGRFSTTTVTNNHDGILRCISRKSNCAGSGNALRHCSFHVDGFEILEPSFEKVEKSLGEAFLTMPCLNGTMIHGPDSYSPEDQKSPIICLPPLINTVNKWDTRIFCP